MNKLQNETIEIAVRRVLCRCLRHRLDVLDRACLDLAVEATAAVLILDARMKRGPLLGDQSRAYVEACRARDAALRALGIADPYRAKAA